MQAFEQALSAQRDGRFKEAEDLYRRILSKEPGNFDALHMLGIVCSENGNPSAAERFFMAALSIDSKYPPLLHNYGLFLGKQKRYQESVDQFDAALKLFDKSAPIYCDRGISLMELGRLDEALSSHNMAVKLAPDVSIAFFNRGNTLFRKREFASALRDYDRAIALSANYSDAYCGRGNACHEIKKYEEGLVAYNIAITLRSGFAEAWLGCGNIFLELKRYQDATAAYDKAIALKPDLAEAWVGLGNVLVVLKRYDEALVAFDKATASKRDSAEAWLGRGNIHVALKQYENALIAFDEAIAKKGDLAEAWLGRGNAFVELRCNEEAFAAYDRALSLKPDLTGLEGLRLHSKMFLCDWSNFDAECAHLISSAKSGKVNTQPFPLLSIPSSSREQLQCARLWIDDSIPPSSNTKWRGDRYRHDRVRVAYISADFREHAVTQLMAGVFARHDKSRFDITAISIGPDDRSKIRRRVMESFGRFIEAQTLDDLQIANLVRELEIDILVDLMGFTAMARTNVFAMRPAPLQICHLGYPGTMGAEYIDYIVADQIVVPEAQYPNYSEKAIVLPNTYFPTSYQDGDPDPASSARDHSRKEMGLPPGGFVFCCFNKSYKIIPRVFDCWMRILKRVDGSVLWLSESGDVASRNLRERAIQHGVSVDRLLFAKPLPQLSDHLTRYHLAGLFLDTLPYNAHTTAADALWKGLPVLTCIGETFAGRAAASLLHAVGLPELVTPTLEAYEDMAVDLALNVEKLAAIKQRLAANRLSSALFDTGLFTRNLEAAYAAIYERHQGGLAPNHIVI
jgi:protein O-GlcNAc transferase